MGLRRRFWYAFAGVPRGPLGWVGARVIAKKPGFFRAMAAELELQPDDVLLDVGCGAGDFLADQASHVGHVAGLDASEIPLSLARRRLADRIAAGTAEVVKGDAAALPWADGRFSVVTSQYFLKFLPHPEAALREMCRVLRPGGRAVVTLSDTDQRGWGATDRSGTADGWGQWFWSDADAQRLMAEAGFADVAVSVGAGAGKPQLVRGVKPVPAGIERARETAAPAESVAPAEAAVS
ncbi:MAG: methyltransferase domain-containing protein [Chloroflexota bacterium]